MTKTILYIHQASELYGSDKTLYYLVKGINEHPNFNVIVVLPNDGPLKQLLEASHIKVIIFPVIKVSREMFAIRNIVILPFTIITATKALRKILVNKKIDIVHSNTLAVLLGAFFAKRYRIKHIWHIHEIIKKPTIVRILYPFLVNNLSYKVVFNSMASKDFFCFKHHSIHKKAVVNLNGIDRDVPLTSIEDRNYIRKEIFNADGKDIVLGLIGRISKWKGQQLLLESFHQISQEFNNLKLMFVGSAPPNQEYLVEELLIKIKRLDIENECKIIPFQNNIWSIWDSIDVAIIPSTDPEPFGLVAVEAMLAKKPVIAAKHGGLIEIIKDNETGYFFKPNDTKDLQRVIKKLILDQNKLQEFGVNGYKRAQLYFSLKKHIEEFIIIYQNTPTL
ncbi:MAG: glycosyltransferase family 4 protein [Chlorobi bacterium]|nr:glycosyltransferase family 4 protein [Chlorobiota bacterium]